MGFMDKLKETAEKAAEKAGAMKDSAMDTYGKMKEANEQKKAEKQAYTAAMEQEVKEYSDRLIESIVAGYSAGGRSFWGEGNRAAIDKFTKDYYEISCMNMQERDKFVARANYILDKNVLRFIYDDTDVVLVFIGINKRHARQNLQLLVDNGTEIAFVYSVKGKADVDRLGIKYTVQ